MIDQVARRERENSVVFRQAKEFAPASRGKIPGRDALDVPRRQIYSGQFTQEIKFYFSLWNSSLWNRSL
jgi:hypothetical protein